jgi:hypothetical protein
LHLGLREYLGFNGVVFRPALIWINQRQLSARRLSWREVVLSDGDHGAGLRPIVPFALVDDIADLVAFRESVETAVRHRVPVHIDLAALARSDETVTPLLEELSDMSMAWCLMSLDITTGGASVILKLPSRRIERITNSDQNVLMRVVFRGIALDDDLASGNRQVDTQMVQLALAVVMRARFHDDTARDDSSEKAVEGFGTLADMCFDSGRRCHIAEGDL